MGRFSQLWIFAVAALIVGCSPKSSPPTTRAQPTRELSYPYELSASDKVEFLDTLKTLRPGQTIEEVVDILGAPYSQDTIMPKESNEPQGIRSTYYLKKLGNGVNRKFDQSIGLTYGNDRRLREIDTNIIDRELGELAGIDSETLTLEDLGKSIEAEWGKPHVLTPIFPKALSPGDTILFVAPAKYLEEPRMMLAKKRLEEMGFKVRVPETLFRKHSFFAGTDEERARELMGGFSDPEVDAIFPGTGGYGTTRILDRLDYDVIRRNPKMFIGFSDITALHVAINQRTGLVTFHSPVAEYGLGSDEGLSPMAARWFWRAVLADKYRGPLSGGGRAGYTIYSRPDAADSERDDAMFEGGPKSTAIVEGLARGRLIGGNLSVVHALMGTPFEIQTDGKILILEDVGEAPYRVDRMLQTLKTAGKFDHVAGVVLGGFSARKEDQPWDESDGTIDDVLQDYFGEMKVPVIKQFPFGHGKFNSTLPIGVLAELDATRGTIRLLENPVTLPVENTEKKNTSAR